MSIPVLDLFRSGVAGDIPTEDVCRVAEQMVVIGDKFFETPDFVVDPDGSLSLDARLRNGYLVLAELSVDGRIDMSIYDRRGDRVDRLVTLFLETVAHVLRHWADYGREV